MLEPRPRPSMDPPLSSRAASAANPSAPLWKSTGLVATITRTVPVGPVAGLFEGLLRVSLHSGNTKCLAAPRIAGCSCQAASVHAVFMRRSARLRHSDHRAFGQPLLVRVRNRLQQAHGIGGTVQQVRRFHQAVVVHSGIRTMLRALRRVITSGARPLHGRGSSRHDETTRVIFMRLEKAAARRGEAGCGRQSAYCFPRMGHDASAGAMPTKTARRRPLPGPCPRTYHTAPDRFCGPAWWAASLPGTRCHCRPDI
jgi:hypothetical protein